MPTPADSMFNSLPLGEEANADMKECQVDIIYKILTPELVSRKTCQWDIGTWKRTDGMGGLCGPGWLHAYSDPRLAVLMNPIHGNYREPFKLFRGEATGRKRVGERGLKHGYTEMRVLEEVPVPIVTPEQRIRTAISCIRAVPKRSIRGAEYKVKFDRWLFEWETGKNRTMMDLDDFKHAIDEAQSKVGYLAVVIGGYHHIADAIKMFVWMERDRHIPGQTFAHCNPALQDYCATSIDLTYGRYYGSSDSPDILEHIDEVCGKARRWT